MTIPNKKPIPVTAICCAMTELKFNGGGCGPLLDFTDDDTDVADDTDDDDDSNTKSVIIVCIVMIKNPIAMVPIHFCNAIVFPFIGCIMAVVICNCKKS